ncbi:MAG: sulfite exporter TauE/SafE family protein [Gammaproteobacteria bacterium]|nr:sulfite exporter TauE/SafE family protein [Gammaproteobacteria bacterium]
MDITISNLAAFTVGFFGGVHCVGMCGGIVGALSFGLPEEKRHRLRGNAPFLLLYNFGRIGSYTLAGTITGGLGAWAIDLLSIRQLQLWLQLFAGVFMILMGLYLNGWWRVLVRVEEAGSVIWQRLEPFGRKLLPVQSPKQAFLLGALWGWLPCGLVYSVLIWTLVSGGAQEGAMLMLSFGLGTLPNLLAMGVFAVILQKVVQQDWVRQLSGAVVMAFGIYMIWRAFTALV